MNQLVKKSFAECRRWFAALLLVAAGSLVCLSAQDQLVTVKVDNRPVSEAIKIIEKESNMIFFYQSGVLDLNRKVTVNAVQKPLADVLNQVFTDNGIGWSVNGRQISLRPEAPAKKEPAKTEKKSGKKTHSLRGAITDATTGEPLIGATVVVKGSKGGGTSSDIDGNYTIDVPDNGEVVISYIGYTPQTLSVGDLGVLDVKLSPTGNELA